MVIYVSNIVIKIRGDMSKSFKCLSVDIIIGWV